MADDPEYLEWESQVPDEIRSDPLWTLRVYRWALFLGDKVAEDLASAAGELELRSRRDQIMRAVDSISSNISEGFSRSGGADRLRFYEYSLALPPSTP